MIGTYFKEWKIEELLGEGSFGKVYRITRQEFGYTYQAALKVIEIPQNNAELQAVRNDASSEEEVEEYFQSVIEDIVKEFVLMTRLKGNTNIVSYEDHAVIKNKDRYGWTVCIRMELLTSLMQYIKVADLSNRDVIQMGIDICKALEVCKQYNIIHRDIKPDNIFVSDLGNYKLGDFGIARELEKTTGGLSQKGTRNYMGPEIFRGNRYNATVDLYSLGIVMYRFMNNNRLPFYPPYPEKVRYSDKEEAENRRISGEKLPLPVNASPELAAIILKACAFDPKERYENATQMREALEVVLEHEKEEEILFHASEIVKQKPKPKKMYSPQTKEEEDGTVLSISSLNFHEKSVSVENKRSSASETNAEIQTLEETIESVGGSKKGSLGENRAPEFNQNKAGEKSVSELIQNKAGEKGAPASNQNEVGEKSVSELIQNKAGEKGAPVSNQNKVEEKSAPVSNQNKVEEKSVLVSNQNKVGEKSASASNKNKAGEKSAPASDKNKVGEKRVLNFNQNKFGEKRFLFNQNKVGEESVSEFIQNRVGEKNVDTIKRTENLQENSREEETVMLENKEDATVCITDDEKTMLNPIDMQEGMGENKQFNKKIAWMGGALLLGIILMLLLVKVIGSNSGKKTQVVLPAATKTATAEPTEVPTEEPTEKPTEKPTERPTEKPTEKPTKKPTKKKVKKETEKPKATVAPTREPVVQITQQPTRQPTRQPEVHATRRPVRNTPREEDPFVGRSESDSDSDDPFEGY